MSIDSNIDQSVIRVSGEIDLANVGQLERALDAAISRHPHVTVHVEDVTFMGLEGARALVRAAEALPDRGRLYVLGPSPQLMRVVDILVGSRFPKLVLLPEC